MVVPEQSIGDVAKRSTDDHAESHRKTGASDSSHIKDHSSDDQQLYDRDDRDIPSCNRVGHSRVIKELKRKGTEYFNGVCCQIRFSQRLGNLVDGYYARGSKACNGSRRFQKPHRCQCLPLLRSVRFSCASKTDGLAIGG